MPTIDEEAFNARFRSDAAFAAALVSAPNIAAARVAAASYGYVIDAAALSIALQITPSPLARLRAWSPHRSEAERRCAISVISKPS